MKTKLKTKKVNLFFPERLVFEVGSNENQRITTPEQDAGNLARHKTEGYLKAHPEDSAARNLYEESRRLAIANDQQADSATQDLVKYLVSKGIQFNTYENETLTDSKLNFSTPEPIQAVEPSIPVEEDESTSSIQEAQRQYNVEVENLSSLQQALLNAQTAEADAKTKFIKAENIHEIILKDERDGIQEAAIESAKALRQRIIDNAIVGTEENNLRITGLDQEISKYEKAIEERRNALERTYNEMEAAKAELETATEYRKRAEVELSALKKELSELEGILGTKKTEKPKDASDSGLYSGTGGAGPNT